MSDATSSGFAPLDPVLAALTAAMPPPSLEAPDFPTLRLQSTALAPALWGPGGQVLIDEVRDVVMVGASGPASVRVYRPTGATPGPTVLFFHGGGWTLGDVEGADNVARRMARGLGVIVVSASYRLAPEHPFPAAYEDALFAANWVIAHAANLGGDPNRVIVSGDSAGGNLAAAVAIGLKESGGIQPAGQLLIYPATDLRQASWTLPSRLADADPSLRVEALKMCKDAYLAGFDGDDWRVSPVAHRDLSGLPTALIATVEIDPLRDDGKLYAAALAKAGVTVETVEYAGLTHGFPHLSGLVPAAASAFEDMLARAVDLFDLGIPSRVGDV